MGGKKRKNKLSKPVRPQEIRRSEVPKQLPDKEVAVLSYRDRIRHYAWPAGVLAGSIAAAALVGSYNCEKRGGTKHAEESVSVQKFDPRSYQPPKEGRIWKQSKELDPDRQTIVYIPDMHGLPDRPETWPVQKEIFAIVEDAIQKYGRVPLVLEEWIDYGKGADYSFEQHVQGNYLQEFAAEPDLEKRRAMALSLISRGKGRGTTFLPVVYRKELIPLASQDRAQSVQALAAASFFFSMGDVVRQNTSCDAFVFSTDMPLSDAMRNPDQSVAADGLFLYVRWCFYRVI